MLTPCLLSMMGMTTAAAGIIITRNTCRARQSRIVAKGVAQTTRKTVNRACTPTRTLAVGTTTTTIVWTMRIDEVRALPLRVFFRLIRGWHTQTYAAQVGWSHTSRGFRGAASSQRTKPKRRMETGSVFLTEPAGASERLYSSPPAVVGRAPVSSQVCPICGTCSIMRLLRTNAYRNPRSQRILHGLVGCDLARGAQVDHSRTRDPSSVSPSASHRQSWETNELASQITVTMVPTILTMKTITTTTLITRIHIPMQRPRRLSLALSSVPCSRASYNA